jgi:hypothetical protein
MGKKKSVTNWTDQWNLFFNIYNKTLACFDESAVGLLHELVFNSASSPITSWPLKTGLISCTKISVTNYQSMLHNIPEQQRPQYFSILKYHIQYTDLNHRINTNIKIPHWDAQISNCSCYNFREYKLFVYYVQINCYAQEVMDLLTVVNTSLPVQTVGVLGFP